MYISVLVVACANLDCYTQSRWLGRRVPHSRSLCHHTRGIRGLRAVEYQLCSKTELKP